MRIFAIDDEQAMLEELHEAIAKAEPNAEIQDYRRAKEALRAITDEKIIPDVVFSDIELPGTDGLSLAVKIKQSAPEVRIVFVTGFSQYALDAFRIHANGYVMKPIDARQIREELDALPSVFQPDRNKIQVQCFGFFEVYWQGKPLVFERNHTKELFAFLIDRKSVCTAEEISAVLWEDETDMQVVKSRLRTIIHDLKNTLSAIGMENIIIRRRGIVGIRQDKIDCDYYRLLDGDMQAVNSFYGRYMEQYSWAEPTVGSLMDKF